MGSAGWGQAPTAPPAGWGQAPTAPPAAPALTLWQILAHCREIVLVDVELGTRDGRALTLPRITILEEGQVALRLQLGWTMSEQPPPRIRSRQLPHPNRPPSAGRHRKCVADLRAETPGNP